MFGGVTTANSLRCLPAFADGCITTTERVLSDENDNNMLVGGGGSDEAVVPSQASPPTAAASALKKRKLQQHVVGRFKCTLCRSRKEARCGLVEDYEFTYDSRFQFNKHCRQAKVHLRNEQAREQEVGGRRAS
jgi:hypothetical protein